MLRGNCSGLLHGRLSQRWGESIDVSEFGQRLANVPIELSMISEVSYLHPTTYAWIASLLGVIALVACVAPARRATKLDPMQVLRHE